MIGNVAFDLSLGNGPSEADILKVVNDPLGPVTTHLRKVGRRVVIAARAQVGKDTGELARSIHYNVRKYGGLPEVWIGTYNNIAWMHHEGTRPHAISARNAQYLRFSSKGRMVYARTVMHPGTKPNRFLTDNIYLARL
ncbi:tail assembly chaperone [Microbacterium phage Pumpernickel]|uniref:Tail assembly chaperone n=1 Tax=Microbacterium phage Pumpernickel TaxID=2885983 RepID=A0AAE8Y9X1_9CAUD|nr:tail assembly chaperone [Microbacterium phage Pumpernickel]UDL15882.1 tail assembly chaperone [Microbacterium phage Pumpernickel]